MKNYHLIGFALIASIYILSSCAGKAYQKCGKEECHDYHDGILISDKETAQGNSFIVK